MALADGRGWIDMTSDVAEWAIMENLVSLEYQKEALSTLRERHKLGERVPLLLKLTREQLEVTQQELSDLVGCSRSLILQIERGATMNERIYDDGLKALAVIWAQGQHEMMGVETDDDEVPF